MKNIKFTAVVVILIAGTTSSVFASWWNPTTWKIFTREKKVSVQKTDNTSFVSTTTFDKLNENNLLSCNGSKYNKCPEGQTFVCPTNGEDAFCEKNKTNEIKTPKTKEAPVVQNTTKIIKNKVDSEPKNYNYLVIDFNNSIINSVKENIEISREFKSLMEDRNNKTKILKNEFDARIVESVPQGVNIPNDIYRALYSLCDSNIKLIDTLIKKQSNVINSLSSAVVELSKNNSIYVSKFYTKDQASDLMQKMMVEYDILEKVTKMTSNDYQLFLENVSTADEAISEALISLEKNANEYAYAKSLQEKASPGVYQIEIPKIELPKTTYCSTRYTGIQGSYEITCNER